MKRNPWTQTDIDNLVKYYGTVYSKELQIKYFPNRSVQAIRQQAFKLGLKNPLPVSVRKYLFQENFFENPNIINCYWAGYIAADGCVSRRSDIQLKCSINDVHLLEEFKQNCGFDGPIRIKKKVKMVSPINGKTYKCKNQSFLTINNSKKWANDLQNNWNIIPAKSLKLQPPKLTDKDLILSYIIGYIDGDGSIFKSNDKTKNKIYQYLIIHICSGSKNIIQWIRQMIYKYCLNEKTMNKIGKNTTYYIKWKGKRARKIYEILSQIATPTKCNRKWNY